MPPMVETHLVNTVLTNGARYYVDHAHPEFSSPECRDALEALPLRPGRRADRIRSMEAADLASHDGSRLVVYKNNSDGKGNSYGCHENYLMDREPPSAGSWPASPRTSSPASCSAEPARSAPRRRSTSRAPSTSSCRQRAEFFEEQVGLETTLKRPIVNTRDEPHADPHRYRRLHVIVGDANLAEVATFLKLGTTVAGAGHDRGRRGRRPALALADPVRAIHAVAVDRTFTAAAADGRRLDGHGPRHPVGALLPGPQVRRRPGARLPRAPRRSGPPSSSGGSRCSTASRPTPRPLPARSTGWPSCSSSRPTGTATAWAGTTPGWPPSTCSTTTCGPHARSSPGSTPSGW